MLHYECWQGKLEKVSVTLPKNPLSESSSFSTSPVARNSRGSLYGNPPLGARGTSNLVAMAGLDAVKPAGNVSPMDRNRLAAFIHSHRAAGLKVKRTPAARSVRRQIMSPSPGSLPNRVKHPNATQTPKPLPLRNPLYAGTPMEPLRETPLPPVGREHLIRSPMPPDIQQKVSGS